MPKNCVCNLALIAFFALLAGCTNAEPTPPPDELPPPPGPGVFLFTYGEYVELEFQWTMQLATPNAPRIWTHIDDTQPTIMLNVGSQYCGRGWPNILLASENDGWIAAERTEYSLSGKDDPMGLSGDYCSLRPVEPLKRGESYCLSTYEDPVCPREWCFIVDSLP